MNVLLRIEVRGLADFVSAALVPHGHRVVQIAPVDGSMEAEHHRSDVAIIEAHPLDASAPDRIRSLRARFGQVPLLVLDSGLVARERVEILEAGANTILTIPCTPAELVAHVDALGRIRAAAREFAASCVAARLPYGRLEALTEREVDVFAFAGKRPHGPGNRHDVARCRSNRTVPCWLDSEEAVGAESRACGRARGAIRLAPG